MKRFDSLLLASALVACGGDAVTVAATSASATTGAGATSTSSTGGAGGASVTTTTSSEVGGSSSGPTTTTASTSSTAAGGSAASTGAGGGETCTGKTMMAGDYDESLMSGGQMRTFHLHVPPSYSSDTATPLVLLFHGFTETDTAIEAATHFDAVADAHGFVVAYPQGIDLSFNAGGCCGIAVSSGVDDVKFASDLIDKLEGDLCVDDKRVFSSGFSNGGMMSHRLACELSDRIAAIGAVSGTIAIPTCTPTRPVPVLHIHGKDDIVVAYDNGGLSGGEGVPQTISTWVANNGCTDAMPTNMYLMGDVSCDQYMTCNANANVQLCTVSDGGHQWPGGSNAGIGFTSMDLDASEYIAEFFDTHPMP